MTIEQLAYDVVDVFTDRAFAGNPLAVVRGAGGLGDAQLQAIATEFNLSETTFPVPMTEADRSAGADYRVRIFTPVGEIPFAGHPTLGTAWVLRSHDLLGTGRRRQACGAGLIDVVVDHDPDNAVELSAVPRDHARQLTPGEVVELVDLVGVTGADVQGPAYTAGCGLSWCYLQVRPAALARARPSVRRVAETRIDLAGLRDPLDGVDVYAVGVTDGGVEVTSRVFVPGYGIAEDPATGSAAAGLGITLVAAAVAAADGDTRYRIVQGVEMGRPSVLHCRVEASAGVATACHVAGQVRPTASGTIAVPEAQPTAAPAQP